MKGDVNGDRVGSEILMLLASADMLARKQKIGAKCFFCSSHWLKPVVDDEIFGAEFICCLGGET